MCSISCICFDWVLGHMVLIKMKLATEGSSHPFTGPERVLQISAKVSRGVIRDWTRRKHRKNRQSKCGQKHTTDSLKKTHLQKNAVEQKPDKNNDRGC